MKILKLGIVFLLAFTLIACSTQKAEVVEEVETTEAAAHVGADFTVTELSDLEAVLATPADFVGKTMMLEGDVVRRCAGAGCWVSFKKADGEEFFVKSKDESFIFPEAVVGAKIRVEGEFMVMSAEKKEAEHEAEGHECPQPQYFLNPLGCEIVTAAVETPEADMEAEVDHS